MTPSVSRKNEYSHYGIQSSTDPNTNMPSKPAKGKLGRALRRARLRKKWSQLTLAHKLGYAGPDAGAFISRLESGCQTGMQTRNLTRFAKILGVSLDELMGVGTK